VNQRIQLVAHRSAVVAPDVAEALRQVERLAALDPLARIVFKGTSRAQVSWEGAVEPPRLSLRPAGREVQLKLQLQQDFPSEEQKIQVELATLWGIVVPLGFTPKNRYPNPGPEDDVFHYFGPWQGLYDHLCSEGRGEEAWPSVCAAAQADIGTWEGDRGVERFVQAQLHRLGLHCGPVDGIIGESTQKALAALAMKGQTLEQLADTLGKFKQPPASKEARRFCHLITPQEDVQAFAYGKIAATSIKTGYVFTVDGPGKVVLTFGEG